MLRGGQDCPVFISSAWACGALVLGLTLPRGNRGPDQQGEPSIQGQGPVRVRNKSPSSRSSLGGPLPTLLVNRETAWLGWWGL